MRLNLGCGPSPLDGFENLTPPEWHFEDGLGDYADGSIEGITISHSLMMVPLDAWPAVFSEIARALESGGIVRISEDDTENPESERYGDGIWHDAVTATGPEIVRKHLRDAGLKTRLWTAETSGFTDESLMQAWHGAAPKCFWIEGRKP